MLIAKRSSLVLGLLLLLSSYGLGSTIWVSNVGNDVSGNGSHNKPYKTIGFGVAEAISGDTVLVRSGTYTGDDNTDVSPEGKAIVIRSEYGPASTIIDCGHASQTRGFVFQNGESNSTKLIGFTIRNGNACYYPVYSGGALFIGSSPVVQNCVFESCKALVGGAIQIFNPSSLASPIIKGCTFSFDSTIGTGSGGAINCALNAEPEIENCIFKSNFSDYHGGAIAITNGSIDNCLFISNYTDGWGTIYTEGIVEVSYCTFSKNGALLGGGSLAVFGEASNVTISNCLMAFNLTTGIVCGESAEPLFLCNNFYKNIGGNFQGDCDSASFDPAEIVFEDPLFCNIENDIYTISSMSPCNSDSSLCGLLIGCYESECDRCCNHSGDINNSGVGPDISDLVYMVNYMFSGGPEPPCMTEADTNSSGAGPDISDLVYLVQYMFSGGAEPMCPEEV